MGGAAAGCAGAAAAAAFVTLNTSRFWPTATQGEGERGKDGIARARNDDGDDAAVGGSTTDPLFLCGESVRASVRRPLTRALASSLLAPSRNTCACSPSLPPRPGRSLLPPPPPLLSFSSCSRHHHHRRRRRRRTHLELFFFFVRVPPSLPPSAVPPAAAQATFYGQGNHDFS